MNNSVTAVAGNTMTLSGLTPSTLKTVEVQWKVEDFQFLVDAKESIILSQAEENVAEKGPGVRQHDVNSLDIPDENILTRYFFPINYDDDHADFFQAFLMLTEDLEKVTVQVQLDPEETGRGKFQSSQWLARISATIFNGDGTIAVCKIDPQVRNFNMKRGCRGWHELFPLSELDSLLDNDGALTIVLKVMYFCPNGVKKIAATPPPDSKVSYDYLELLSQPDFSDFEIKVGEGEEQTRSFKCHKAILAVRSPVFRAMLRRGSESLESRTGIVEIPGVSGEVMQHFLEYLYSGRFSEDLEDSLLATPKWVKLLPQLMELGDKYGVLDLLELCDSKLIQAANNTNVFYLVELAMRLRLKKAVSELKRFITKNSDEIFSVPEDEKASKPKSNEDTEDSADPESSADGVGDGDVGEA